MHKDVLFSTDNKRKGMVSKHILGYVKDFEINLADELFSFLFFFAEL